MNGKTVIKTLKMQRQMTKTIKVKMIRIMEMETTDALARNIDILRIDSDHPGKTRNTAKVGPAQIVMKSIIASETIMMMIRNWKKKRLVQKY
jgi:hypothetical protein